MSTDDKPGALLWLPPAMRSIPGKSEASHELLPHRPLHRADRSSANMAEVASESKRELRTERFIFKISAFVIFYLRSDGNDAFENVNVVGQQQCECDFDHNNALFKYQRLPQCALDASSTSCMETLDCW
jgi:hypothetical protein